MTFTVQHAEAEIKAAWDRQDNEMTIDWLRFEFFIRNILRAPDEEMDAVMKLAMIDNGLAAFTGRGSAPLNMEHMK